MSFYIKIDEKGSNKTLAECWQKHKILNQEMNYADHTSIIVFNISVLSWFDEIIFS